MKIRFLTILLVIVGLTAIITVNGCKKKEPSPANSNLQSMEKVAGDTMNSAANIEQTTCPVMGGAVDKDIYVEHKGKKVYFCCKACVEEFEKSPEKYISKLPQFGN